MTCSFSTAETVGFKLPEKKSGMFNLSLVEKGGHKFSRIVFTDEDGIVHPISEGFSFSEDAHRSAQQRLQITRLLSETNAGLRALGRYRYIRQESKQLAQ